MSPLFQPIRLSFVDVGDVHVVSLRQSLVYEGLLEGLPTREMNERRLDQLQHDNPRATLVRPEERPLEYSGRYPFGTPSALPDVQCEARLKYSQGLHAYEAELLWFQENWAPPLDEALVAYLANASWFALSTRYEI
ncbi:MAG: hypothetical protein AAGN82_11860 [Myxococcota bacterium]